MISSRVKSLIRAGIWTPQRLVRSLIPILTTLSSKHAIPEFSRNRLQLRLLKELLFIISEVINRKFWNMINVSFIARHWSVYNTSNTKVIQFNATYYSLNKLLVLQYSSMFWVLIKPSCSILYLYFSCYGDLKPHSNVSGGYILLRMAIKV